MGRACGIYISQTLSFSDEDDMDDRDVIILSDYIRTNYPDNYVYVSDYALDKRAYSKGAALQILELLASEAELLPSHITGRENASAIDIIEDYIIDVNYYAETCDDSKTRFMFTTARDEAKKILQLYLERRAR